MIYNKYLGYDMEGKVSTIINSLKKAISFKNILFIILSFIMSSQNFMGEFSPFSFVLFGVASVFNVPLLLVLISSGLGMLIGHITTIAIVKLLTFFALFTLITALINIEGVSKKYCVFIKLMISIVVVEVGFGFVQGILFTDVFKIFSNILIIAILYYVYVAGAYVLLNINKGYVYSKEESIAMITVVALGLAIFKDLNMFGFSIFNILVLVLILVYGWKSGAIAGAASGLIVRTDFDRDC
ncbi:MAG: hypothetical protein RSE00_02675 [Clostridia bacterium]